MLTLSQEVSPLHGIVFCDGTCCSHPQGQGDAQLVLHILNDLSVLSIATKIFELGSPE